MKIYKINENLFSIIIYNTNNEIKNKKLKEIISPYIFKSLSTEIGIFDYSKDSENKNYIYFNEDELGSLYTMIQNFFSIDSMIEESEIR